MRVPLEAATAFLFLSILAGAAKINTPRVLLPWLGADSYTRVNFTFEITDGGCYSWSLSHEDLVSLEPLYEESWGHCSRAARVAPLPACSPPGSVIILAEDVSTGEIIRGDVDVDRISSLKIVSTTWKLFLEEAPEAFEVEAFDDPGNKFSSLEGVEFIWKVGNTEDKKHEDPVVKLVWWRDTDYEAPQGIYELESRGKRSHSVLLYGQTMGESRVTVCLNATCADVSLRVVASVVLTPASAVVAQGDTIRYKIVRARAGRLTVQDIADSIYRLHVPDDGIAILEDSVSLVHGSAVGSTSLSLISGSTEVASSKLIVSTAHSIRVHLRPSDLLVRGEPFLAHAITMDKEGRALTAGDRTLVRLTVEGDAEVTLLRSTENGTLTDAVPNTTGSFTIVAQLHSVAWKVLSRKVEGRTEATVVEPLQVIPAELFIAWTNVQIEVQLHHCGGDDGPLSWAVEPAAGEVAVAAGGVVRASSVGRATVRAHLTRHPHVRAKSQVWVLEAEYLRVSSSGHVRLGRVHPLHVALTGVHPDTGELFAFHKCDCESFAVSLLEGPEPHNVTAATWIEPLEGACCVLTMAWRERGACALRVSRGSVGDTARVLVRPAPQLVWPPAAAMLLGASVPVVASGEALTARTMDTNVAGVRTRGPPAPRANPHLQLFTLSCQRRGDTSLELELHDGDAEGAEGGEGAADGGGVRAQVTCAAAAARVRLDVRTAQNCSFGGAPDAAKSGPWLWLRGGSETRVGVALLDAVGRELMDERGHRVSWEASPSHRSVQFSSSDRLLMEMHPEYYPVPVPLSYYQVVKSGAAAVGWSGVIRATAGDASAAVNARVVSPLVVTPQQVYAAWERGVSSDVALVSGGSGRYELEGAREAAATLEGGRLTAAWPAPGRYRLAVRDTCLADELIQVEVRVEEVVSVEVVTARALCSGTCAPLAAVARGTNGRALAVAAEPVWRVVGAARTTGQLCVLREGVATVSAQLAGVWSPEVEVVVFPVLSVRPERVRVPPGGRLQLSHAGGPPPHLATFTYSVSQPDDVLYVTTAGLLSGLRVGSARVRVTALDADGAEMAHAEADVEVVSVSGVRAVAATPTLLVGEPAPLWLEAVELGPAELATLQPSPRVLWSLRDPAAGALAAPLRAQTSDQTSAEGLSVRLVPLRAGPIIVDVRVRNFAQGGETRSWDASVEVLGVSQLRASVEGEAEPAVGSGRVAVAVGGTVRLSAVPRAVWRGPPGPEPAFQLSPAGELRALRPGYGVAVAVYRDDASDINIETVVHVEVAVPHYVTTQTKLVDDDDEETRLRVEARSQLGRRLLGLNLTLKADVSRQHRVFYHAHVESSELVVGGVQSAGAFVTVEAADGARVMRDYVWLEGAAPGAARVRAGEGHAVCLAGGGWIAAGGAWLAERGGVTLVVLRGRGAARLQLQAEGQARTVTIVQRALAKMEFLAGEWAAAFVPLSLTADGDTGGGSTVHCSEEQRLALADLQPELAFTCHAPPPYSAAPAFDAIAGHMGCSVTPERTMAAAEEVEVCAARGALRTCARVLALPPVRLETDQLVLSGAVAELLVTGDGAALDSVTVAGSPGLDVRMERQSERSLAVLVTGADAAECGAGWAWVHSRRTAQSLRVPVRRDCDATCGSLLGGALSLLRPHLVPLLAAAAATAATFWYLKHWNASERGRPAAPSGGAVLPPDTSPRTWHRSPYAAPKPPPSPPAPVYGDTSLLPDSSFSPDATRANTRFL